jgi:hypothetical protein
LLATDALVTKAEEWVRSTCTDPSLVAEHLAIPRDRRQARLQKMLDDLVSRSVDARVDTFKQMLDHVETRRGLVRAVLSDVEIDDASELLRDLDDARAKAVTGMDALETAHSRWSRGIHAACARLLAEYLRSGDPPDTLAKIAYALGRSDSELRATLDRFAGDRKTDGPKHGAELVVADLVGVTARSVRSWQHEGGARFFDYLVRLPPPRPSLAEARTIAIAQLAAATPQTKV